MLHHGGSAEADHQTTPPVAPSSDTERTHVPDPSEAASPGVAPVGGGRRRPEADPKGRRSSGSSPEEDRRRGRPGRVRGGATVSGEGAVAAEEEECCGRERLKRHRVAMAGRVWIPETWGQEALLKDWVDCAAVDRALALSGLVSAREALVEERRRGEPGAGIWMGPRAAA